MITRIRQTELLLPLLYIERNDMTKAEFLDTLRKALNGQVSPGVIAENLNYYDSYISGETRKGRSEQDILDELGDPRLIARTIIDAEGGPSSYESGRGPSYDSYGYSYSDPDVSDSDILEKETRSTFHQKSFHVNKWVVFGILFLVLFIILSVLFFMFKTIFKLLFSFHGIWFWIIILIIIFSLSKRK